MLESLSKKVAGLTPNLKNNRFYLSLSRIIIFQIFSQEVFFVKIKAVVSSSKFCGKSDFEFQGFSNNSPQFSRKNDLKDRQCRS